MSGKDVFVVSDRPDGIVKYLKMAGFDDVLIRSFTNWTEGYKEYFGAHAVALDEVNRDGRAFKEEMSDAEDALRHGEQGPFLIILISDSDHHLDNLFERPKYHRRQIVHRESQNLLVLAQEIQAARRIDALDVSD
ncbi:MAG: hypothetical protein A3E37_05050 [Candidatus Andersenbacteria bacterium RIFCSPHIGHO2_12_FULL_46_9]|nr:MAG: hypothetical protein UW94_C0003G0089 [Parcubacteria group bacterium GW2011_GWA2_45_14]OGY33754.1 MAG: hypothetical protein A3B76_02745 [Candidatus Andersenbacteria bacterium RIFCSPHIGHO2_02_FULL_46_16]OGY36189.1 MAG: hypothetical protein A3I08_05065 [Candidatus Andersenbacteria bacterium RIFCSPLOWO2_02_FULL_46_11]OGY36976.1 MAG: hypothetical protein A3E37_05050 [Candidatus Andersenbacteria bacterium RIFCSPHIGHO2_12_FULL_46_9]OGY39186.1 MAG: hypothetical protein A3G57_02460 [Candidatus A